MPEVTPVVTTPPQIVVAAPSDPNAFYLNPTEPHSYQVRADSF